MHAFTHRVRSIAPRAPASRSVALTCAAPRVVGRPLARSRPRRTTHTPLRSTPRDANTTPPISKDALLHEFRTLLEHRSSSTEWVQDVHGRGTALLTYLGQLQETLCIKGRELTEVQTRLNETSAALDQAQERQSAAEAELQTRSHELVRVKRDLNQLQHDRDSDVAASMERYRELEDALAMVESELRTQTEQLHQPKETPSSPVDATKLGEIVREQNATFENLSTALKTATEEKQRAEESAIEARRKAEDMEKRQTRLRQDQELLSKELSQLQILYAEKELEWMNGVQSIREDCDKLKEESAGLEVTLATKERKLSTVTASMESIKADYEHAEKRLAELKRECAELKASNASLEGQLKGDLIKVDDENVVHLKSQLTRLQVRVPILEGEIAEMMEARKKSEQQYEALEKEWRRSERKCAQLEQRTTILQTSMEEKSNRLVTAHKERRTLKADADRLQREAIALRQRLQAAEREMAKMKEQLQRGNQERQMLQSRYQEEIMKTAENQNEAQKAIVYHQEHKNENDQLKSKIAVLLEEGQKWKGEIERAINAKDEEIKVIQLTLEQAKEALEAKDVELSSAEEEKAKLDGRIQSLKESLAEAEEGKTAIVMQLKQQLQEAEAAKKGAETDFQRLQNEKSQMHNELMQRQRIISVRDQEIVTLKDDARLANERVEALRGQIASMQTLNREMESEMSETDGVVSKMNDELRELQAECEKREQQVTELKKKIADLESKGKHSMDQFSSQIESLEEYSKQQEALVESFFEEKQALEASLNEVKSQLTSQTESCQEYQELYDTSQKECEALQSKLKEVQSELKLTKQTVANEIEEAAEILAKAESMAQSVQGSFEEEDVEHTNGAVSESDWLDRVHELEEALETERQTTVEASEHSAKLEKELAALKQQMAEMKELEKEAAQESSAAAENKLISMSKRLSKSLAAEEAALTEIQHLREQIKELESTKGGQVREERHVMYSDDRFDDLRRQAVELQAENDKLRKAALKRNQILSQSRHFIEQYLNRSVHSLTDMQQP